MNRCYALVALVLIILAIYGIYRSRLESFDPEFAAAMPSTETLKYLDMGDHRTLTHLQKGDSGKTVLLLHNSPMNIRVWLPLFHTMQRMNMKGYRTPNLVAYDMRGHGTAWMPVENRYNDLDINNYAWSLDLFVSDCKRVYDSIVGGGKVIVCGFGFGGFVAQRFALDHPEIVEKLVLLQTSIRPITGLFKEIQYLGGPNGWIARNPDITYLTSEEKYVKETLCNWFYLPSTSGCPPDTLIDADDEDNDWTAPQYNLTAALWRQGSSTTTLQTDKLLASVNLINDWINAKGINFTIHILAATDDPLASPEMMANTYTTIYNNNRDLLVVFDVVNGRHGFTIMRPDYIAGIVCDDCEKISSHTTRLKRDPEHGY